MSIDGYLGNKKRNRTEALYPITKEVLESHNLYLDDGNKKGVVSYFSNSGFLSSSSSTLKISWLVKANDTIRSHPVGLYLF